METSLGKAHSVSPFDGLYAKHLKVAAQITKAPEEEKKAAAKDGAEAPAKKQK